MMYWQPAGNLIRLSWQGHLFKNWWQMGMVLPDPSAALTDGIVGL